MTKLRTLQNQDELAWFIELLKSEGVRSYLEIGSKYGGSIRAIGEALEVPSRLVSVDLPAGGKPKVWPESKRSLEQTINDLCGLGHSAHLVWGDSTDPAIVAAVRALGPYDAVFIDANHTLPYVTKDWQNFGPMARLVAFHDIGWVSRDGQNGKGALEPPILWRSIKDGYRHVEKKLEKRDNGIGVLWRT